MNRLYLLVFIVPAMARAEVMDKEASLGTLWIWAVVSSVVLFLAARFRPKLLLVAAPLPVLFFCGQLLEVMDPFVGSGILREAGPIYVASSWVAPVVALCGLVAGILARRRYHAVQLIAPSDPASRLG